MKRKISPFFFIVFILLILSNLSYAGYFLVWEPASYPSSGLLFKNCLDSLGYSGEYDTDISTHLSHLSLYAEIFIFLGEYPNNYVLQEGEIVDSLCSYLDNGGQIYLEGDDTWWYDPHTTLHDYFCLQGASGGETDSVIGINGVFTEGMVFVYSGNWTPLLTPLGTSFTIFKNENDNSCAVACDTLGYKTVGAGFFFHYLTDNVPPSRKIDLADSVMHFFGNYAGIKEGQDLRNKTKDQRLTISPNPFCTKTEIKWTLGTGHSASGENPITNDQCPMTISIYDASGKLVKSIRQTTNTIQFGSDLTPGTYFLKPDGIDVLKVVKLR